MNAPQQTRPLRDITSDLREVQEMAENGEVIDKAIADTLDAIGGEFQQKAENIGHVLIENDATKKMYKDEIARLQDRLKVLENGDKRLREYILGNMELAGIKTIKGDFVTLTAAQGREIVIIDNEDEVPDEFVDVVTVTKPLKRKIQQKIASGEPVPGAHLERTATSLRIR